MPITEKSLANLKPAKAGEVRNPVGRIKGSLNSKTILKKWLGIKNKSEHPKTKKMVAMTDLDLIILKQIELAKTGNVLAANFILDRYEGKPEQKQNIAFEEGAAEITVRIGRHD